MEKILSYIEIGREEGAEVLTGGTPTNCRATRRRLLFKPTVFKGHNKMRVFQEEIFGPVVSVTTFKDATKRSRSPTTRFMASARVSGPGTRTGFTVSARH